VIARSFERIHRSNLVGMGVLPLVFEDGPVLAGAGTNRERESFDRGVASLKPRQRLQTTITYADGTSRQLDVLCRIDTEEELSYYRHGGILPFVLRNLVRAA
jgi:aconitate hydratase